MPSKHIGNSATNPWAGWGGTSSISILGMSLEAQDGKVGMVQKIGDTGETKDAASY
jgi:hypothetical protein